MVRKVGGFTFQELNLTIDDIRENSIAGPDLSYDFVNRPAYQHALATADTEFLRLTLRTTLESGIDPASLVHALQNHDELTYELVHWSAGHRDDVYTYKGHEITGEELGHSVRTDLDRGAHRARRPRTTWCSPPTASPARRPPSSRRRWASPTSTRSPTSIPSGARTCCWRCSTPCNRACSRSRGGTCAACSRLPPADVSELLRGGDTRWIHRAAHDLMGVNPDATHSSAGMPRGTSLYGSIPDQLGNEASFLRQLQAILAVRTHFGIAPAPRWTSRRCHTAACW